jgi:hypothetical protein
MAVGERQPLLQGHAESQDLTQESETSARTSDVEVSALPFSELTADLAWILAGLWSAVFLGALDG